MESFMPPGISCFKRCNNSYSSTDIQKIAEITPAIKIAIPAVTKKSQRANHAVTEICMTVPRAYTH